MSDGIGYPRKRTQTRNRLAAAGMQVIAERGAEGATIGEIAKAAGVAPGTFYNHFTSIDELIGVVCDRLSHGVEIGSDTLAAIENDPAVRVAIGTLQLLQMAETDRTAASAFVTLVSSKPDFRARIRRIVGGTIQSGVTAGRFSVDAGPAATNAVVGSTVQSMSSRLLDETDASAAPEVARLVLRVLGVPIADTVSVVATAQSRLAAA